jgi:hypothetical protein
LSHTHARLTPSSFSAKQIPKQKPQTTELYEEEADVCEKLEGGCAGAAAAAAAARAAGVGGAGGGRAAEAEAETTEASIKYVQDLPPIAPPGHYSVRVVGTTGESIYDGDALVCVDVDFEMVLPSDGSSSAAALSSAGAMTGETVIV